MRRVRAVVLTCALAVACAPVSTPLAPVSAPLPAPERVAGTPEPVARRGVMRIGESPAEAMSTRTEAYAALAADLARGSSLPAFTGRLANWPINGRVSSPFGPRWGGFHNGLDIAATLHSPVRAALAGQVVTVGKPYLAYGDTATIVIIVHGVDFATVYVHLSDQQPPVVKAGQRVAAGEVIAYNGSTGWSTGPHVHFMTIVNGRAVDPVPYLP